MSKKTRNKNRIKPPRINTIHLDGEYIFYSVAKIVKATKVHDVKISPDKFAVGKGGQIKDQYPSGPITWETGCAILLGEKLEWVRS